MCALWANFKYGRPFAGATTATTGAMQLARPACGDPVATQRTHGSSVYLKKRHHLHPCVRALRPSLPLSFAEGNTFKKLRFLTPSKRNVSTQKIAQ